MQKQHSTARSQKGFTLVEVMVSGLVLVMIFLGALGALQQGFRMIDTARNTTLASQIIQSEIEDLRLKSWAVLCAVPAQSQLDIAGSVGRGLATAESTALAQRFTAIRRVADVADRGGNLKRVTITISWTDSSGISHTRSYETLFGHFGLTDYFVATH
jgi:Tfp pilus assembly protein PilV